MKPETMNNKFKKSQLLMLFLLAALLFITPLLSSSLRPTYLYFIINLLIIALGAEAGLLSVFSNPPEDIKKQCSSLSNSKKPVMVTQEVTSSASPGSEKKSSTRVVEKSASEKISSGGVKMVDCDDKLKKCPSMPSLFFIGGGADAEEEVLVQDDDNFEAAKAKTKAEAEAEAEEEEEEVIAEKVLSGQELFTKAENFIGDFYKQLKMQREESWQKIHGFYQKAF